MLTEADKPALRTGLDKPVIRLKDVTRVYKVGVERIHALDGIDLDILENEYVAVMGPSGSGKSTLMNILGCLDRCTSGTYELNGRNTTRLSSGGLAHVRNTQIGFVFQSFELLPRLNALKNVELPLIYAGGATWLVRRARAREKLVRVGLALSNNPSILLADEPTGNLDSKTSEGVLKLFDQLHREGQTIIIVTHEEIVARHTERILHMRDGKIISDEKTGPNRLIPQGQEADDE